MQVEISIRLVSTHKEDYWMKQTHVDRLMFKGSKVKSATITNHDDECLFALFATSESIDCWLCRSVKCYCEQLKHFKASTWDLQAMNVGRDHNRKATNKRKGEKLCNDQQQLWFAVSDKCEVQTSRFDENLKSCVDLWRGNLCFDMEIYSNCTHKLMIIWSRCWDLRVESKRKKMKTKTFDTRAEFVQLLVWLLIIFICISHSNHRRST